MRTVLSMIVGATAGVLLAISLYSCDRSQKPMDLNATQDIKSDLSDLPKDL